jgi:sec-independent protein translocase protein TatA
MQSIALFSNLAGPEGLLIFFVVLLLFGAKKLPELARGLGQAVKEFSKAKEDVNSEFSRASQLPDYHASHSNYHGDPAHHSAPPSPSPAAPAVTPGSDPAHVSHTGPTSPAPVAAASVPGTVPAAEIPKHS